MRTLSGLTDYQLSIMREEYEARVRGCMKGCMNLPNYNEQQLINDIIETLPKHIPSDKLYDNTYEGLCYSFISWVRKHRIKPYWEGGE